MKRLFIVFMLMGSVAYGADVAKVEKVSDTLAKVTYIAVVQEQTIAELKNEIAGLDVEIVKVQTIKQQHVNGWDAEIARLNALKVKANQKLTQIVAVGVKEEVAIKAPIEAIAK